MNQGVGLGLPMSKKIIELHKWRIGVHSSGPQLGSIFYIDIPCVQDATSSILDIVGQNSDIPRLNQPD